MTTGAASSGTRLPASAAAPRAVILIVDDDAAMRDYLRDELEHEGFRVLTAEGGRAGVERVKQGGVDLVVSDVKMPELDGLDLLREVRAVEPSPYVITITAFGSIDTAIRAVKLGAYDYVTKPFEFDQLLLTIEKALGERALRTEVVKLRAEVARRDRLENLIGRSQAMQEIFDLTGFLSDPPRFDPNDTERGSQNSNLDRRTRIGRFVKPRTRRPSAGSRPARRHRR